MKPKKILHTVNKINSSAPPKMKGVEYRVNKLGDVEQIKKKTKDRDEHEETLNELSDDIIEMLEDVEFSGPGSSVMADEPTFNRMTNQSRPPSLNSSRHDNLRAQDETISNFGVSKRPANIDISAQSARTGLKANVRRPGRYVNASPSDGLDYGATHNESVTGTGAIAMAPSSFGVKPEKKKTKKRLRGFEELKEAFSEYVDTKNVVTLDGFNAYLRSKSLPSVDQNQLLLCLESNEKYIFHRGLCNTGSYWFTEDIK